MKNKKDAGAVINPELANKQSKWKLLGKQKMLIAMSVPFVYPSLGLDNGFSELQAG